jgi:SAM-dependent methyltransferase
MDAEKKAVEQFWDSAACGEDLYLSNVQREGYLEHARRRYELEPIIEEFAGFEETVGRRVLEIGVGLGADHVRFAQAGAHLSGVDLTARAVEHTRRRLALFDLRSNLLTGDAERLAFEANEFDVVYSWGVLHHSPDTRAAVAEVHRVLRPGGVAKVMIYHKWSLVGYMLWTRYALLRLRPWMTLTDIYARYLESPGTKAYTVSEAQVLFGSFQSVLIKTSLTHGDLLESAAGQRHKGRLLALARRIWPRNLLRKYASAHGLFMLVQATK